jgi:hypothetical protein
MPPWPAEVLPVDQKELRDFEVVTLFWGWPHVCWVCRNALTWALCSIQGMHIAYKCMHSVTETSAESVTPVQSQEWRRREVNDTWN